MANKWKLFPKARHFDDFRNRNYEEPYMRDYFGYVHLSVYGVMQFMTVAERLPDDDLQIIEVELMNGNKVEIETTMKDFLAWLNGDD